MAAAVVADGGTDVVGNRVEAAQQLLQAPLSELGVLGQRIVEIRDVGLVMFAVVDLHGLRVNVRLQRREIVRQRRKLVSRELLYLRHCARPVECACPTPHCATRFPPYFAPRNVLSSPTSGGARGGVSAALAALPRRHYVDRSAVLLQLRAGSVHGGGRRRHEERRYAKARAARARLVPLVGAADVSDWSGDHWEAHRRIAGGVGRVVFTLGGDHSDGRPVRTL